VANGRWIADELIDRAWAELDDDERAVFERWLSGASGQDLYMLLRFVRRRTRQSSAHRMKAVKGPEPEER